MIDTVGLSSGSHSSERAQTALATNRLRGGSLTAVQQVSDKAAGRVAPVRVFSVSQMADAGASTGQKLPRGSLVDFVV